MKKVIGIVLTVLGGFGILFAIIFGVVFGGLGIAFQANSNSDDGFLQKSTTMSCYGEVISVEDSVTTIQYEVDGGLYEVDFNMQSSGYPVGTGVTVYYNDNQPEECRVPELTEATFGTLGGVFGGFGIAFAILFGVFGIVCLVVGIILIKTSKPKNNSISY